MSVYRFRLATVLRLRQSERDQRRGELAEAYRVADLLARQADQLARELDGLRRQQRCAVGPGTINVDLLVDSQRYEVALRFRQNQLERQRASVAEEIERRRAALVEADRQVRTLELLRDRQEQQFRQEEERREMQRLDEVAQQRALPREGM